MELWLAICVAALATLGTTLFGIGQQSVSLPALSAFAAVTSVYVTDVKGWLALNRSIANLAALLAVTLAIFDFVKLEQTNQLLALANLLVYLQVILLYQRKDDRIYWQLLMLSLLQVMVATALNFQILFGVLLVVYLILVVVTLSIFLLLREAAWAVEEGAIRRNESDTSGFAIHGGRRRRRETPHFIPEPPRDEVPTSGLSRAICVSALLQATVTIALTGLLFFLVPRSEDQQLVTGGSSGQRMVGFSDSVELGELGSASQSDQEVMQVKLLNANMQAMELTGVPYFRGTVLDTYRSHLDSSRLRRSRWDLDERRLLRTPRHGFSAIDWQNEPLIYQQSVLEPMHREKTVFHVFPAGPQAKNSPARAHPDQTIEIDPKRHQLKRMTPKRRLRFTLDTYGFEKNGDRLRQRDINPVLSPVSETHLAAMPRGPQLDSDADSKPSPARYEDLFPRLRAEAERVLADAGMASADAANVRSRVERARSLESYFLTDPRFSYSLDGQPRDRALDPIEDFIAERPRGHCEYYASALALMLRSQNIPARIVVGFKGGRWNSYGQFFQVEQLHAHSWVEVYLRPDDIPRAARRPTMTHGAWLRLDPTPGDDGGFDQVVASGMFGQARELADYSQYLWGNYVVGLDARRQSDLVYAPLESLSDWIGYFFSQEMWLKTVPEFATSLTKWETWRSLLEHLLTLRGLVVLLLLLLVVYRIGRLARRWPWGFSWRRRRRQTGSAAARRAYPVVEFYQRLERLLAQHGLTRADNQTQHEFAVTAGGELRAHEQLRSVAAVPKQVVDLFYRVRFGGQTLDKQQTDAVEQSLGQLAAALASKTSSAASGST